MFREMRRNKQELCEKDCTEVLLRNTSGVLAVSGDDGYPYAVPLSYAYCGSKLIFHCAKTGHKLDGIARNEKVSFCVIDKDSVMPDEFTTYYRSVIVFGRAHVVTDEDKRIAALSMLAEKYSPNADGRAGEIAISLRNVCLVELDIEHMSGKQAKELVG